MLFWSAAAASIFLKAAAPILIEFLKSRSSRSIMVQRGELRIVITGDDPDKVKEILELLEDRQPVDSQQESVEPRSGVSLPIKVTLRDSESMDSTE